MRDLARSTYCWAVLAFLPTEMASSARRTCSMLAARKPIRQPRKERPAGLLEVARLFGLLREASQLLRSCSSVSALVAERIAKARGSATTRAVESGGMLPSPVAENQHQKCSDYIHNQSIHQRRALANPQIQAVTQPDRIQTQARAFPPALSCVLHDADQ